MIISTIGSCRVAGPVTKLQAQRSFVLDNRLLYGFTHNTKETIQAIRFMRGELRLPESLWPFISDQPFRNGNSTPPPQDAHYVVEISSVKVLELDGLYLQLVRFKEALSVCPDLRKIFFDHPGADQRGQRLQLLQATPSFARLATHIQHALTHTVVRSQTAAEIEEDLHAIAQLLGPKLVLVTHCNAKNATGELIAERAKMVARVAQAAARLGLVSVDPGALLAGFGQERGMPDEGLDTAHYTPAFAKLVGKEISDKLLGPAITDDAADSLHNLDFRACMERSKQSAQAHEWDLALLFANRAIELKPGSGSAYVLRARAVTALDQTEDMLEAWSLALATDSNRTPYVLRQAAEAAFYMRDHERAREWAEASLQKEDDDKTALLLGRIYTRLGMNTQAEQVFRRCAASDPARSLRFAARAHTPLADAASMVNALTTTPAADPGSVDGVRQTVLKRATREVRHAGRAGRPAALAGRLLRRAHPALGTWRRARRRPDQPGLPPPAAGLRGHARVPEQRRSHRAACRPGGAAGGRSALHPARRQDAARARPQAGRHQVLGAPRRRRAAGRPRYRGPGRQQAVATRGAPHRRLRVPPPGQQRRHGHGHGPGVHRQMPARPGPQRAGMHHRGTPARRRAGRRLSLKLPVRRFCTASSMLASRSSGLASMMRWALAMRSAGVASCARCERNSRLWASDSERCSEVRPA